MALDGVRSTTSADNYRLADPPPSVSPEALRADYGNQPYTLEPSYNPSLAALQGQTGGAAANGASFDAQVRGQDAKPIDLQMMEIATAVYDPNVQDVGNGWTRVSDGDLRAAGIDPATLENPDTGFRAGIYTNGDGQYVLAYAGSNEQQDWTGANFEQGVGWQNEQYDQAVQLAQQADRAFGDNLVITGHSLGGGLAATGALATGNAAVTFNASGVHDNTIERMGLDPATARTDAADGQIRRYNISGDPLTAAQEDTFGVSSIMPDAPGHEINLADPYPPIHGPDLTDWPWVVAGNIAEHAQAKLERAGALHGQQGVLDALRADRPWDN